MKRQRKIVRVSRPCGTALSTTVQFPTGRTSAIANHAAPTDGTFLPPDSLTVITPELERLVRGLAGRLHARLPQGCGIELSDLVQAGNVGLLQAAGSFDPRQGAPLAGFARYRIRGEMLDMVRRQAGRDRPWLFSPLSGGDGEGWEARIADASERSPQNVVAQRQRSEIIGQEILRLPPRHRTVVRLRYSGEMTLQQIGSQLRVNESRACQIHRNALKRLRRALFNRGVCSLAQL